MFFSYLNFTNTSNASGLNAQTRYTLEGLNLTPPQRALINDPRAETNHHRTASSFGIVGTNPYFNQAIQNDLNEMRNRVNRLSSFSGYYGSSAHKNELIEKLGHIYANALANQYNFEVLKSIPIATTEELKNMASGGMMGENSYFSEKLREGLQKIADSTNKQFQGVGRYNSDKRNNVSYNKLNDIHARAMAAQHNHDVEHMLLANAMLDQRNQNQ